MSEEPHPGEAKCRAVGGTEHSWCKAVVGGTGITVLAVLLSKAPPLPVVQNALHKLQHSHPILRSNLHLDPTTNTFSYIITPSTSHLQIQTQTFHNPPTSNNTIPPLQLILEHELNTNSWTHPTTHTHVFFPTLYTLTDHKWVVALRFHTSVCDRTSAVALLRELLDLIIIGEGRTERELHKEAEVSSGIEDYIPSGKANKPFWARGVDMLGYSLNSFRLSNLEFEDTHSPRSSKVVRLKLNSEDTDRILSGCKSRGIKLCGLLAAAGLIAARSSKCLTQEQWEKYAVTTLIDCRSILDPVLSSHHLGFYHSAFMNTHDMKGGEELWELARRTYTSFANAKNNNKHFTDMADLNFLMCKAIDNPGLTPSSSLRTSIISVFEDIVTNHSNESYGEIGLEDYIGCASVHGVGPSIAIFDTINNGELDCVCVYPSPLHSREQMQDMVDTMKRILVDGGNHVEENQS